MKLKNGKTDQDSFFDELLGGSDVVSRETALRHEDPTSVLLMRDPLDGKHNGVLFVFSLNPQHLKYEHRAHVAVQEGRGGYVVNQNGLGAPKWTIQGHFGWKMRQVLIPEYVAQGVLGKFIAGGNIIHRVPRLDNDIRDIKFSLGSGNFLNPIGQWLVGDKGTITGKGEYWMDGQQAWFALRDLITYYFEVNMQRVADGKPPYELVWYDSLHSLKWVVVPSGPPTLERSVGTQGTMPYTLEFVGVYNDARRRDRGWKLLDAWDAKEDARDHY